MLDVVGADFLIVRVALPIAAEPREGAGIGESDGYGELSKVGASFVFLVIFWLIIM